MAIEGYLMNWTAGHRESALSRRDFLERGGAGFGALALAYLLGSQTEAAGAEGTARKSPLAPKSPHFPAKAKSVIFLFMDGGPSHLDLFDPKPLLNRLAGQSMPDSFDRPITPMGVSNNPILGTKRKFSKHGQSGIAVSDWLPHLATCVDDMAVLRSCWANGLNHVGSVCQMNTGSILAGRPSLGAWVSYGLGSENENLPAFVVMTDSDKTPPGGTRVWGTGFMPATYQGTRFRNGPAPILNLAAGSDASRARLRRQLDFLADLNARHAAARPEKSQLEARIASYELAFRMQSEAPAAVDLSGETAETLQLYGVDRSVTQALGEKCLLARRLVERGVRFVQVYCGAGSRWDAHSKIEENHAQLCQASDKPVAGLLKDLKRRGLLSQTLVVWGGEFGRTPMSEKGDGRDHNPYGFTMWLAGGGVQGGRIVGATDDLGLFAVKDRIHVHHLHATILRLLGMDHLKLTYRHNGRDERATVDGGKVVEQIL